MKGVIKKMKKIRCCSRCESDDIDVINAGGKLTVECRQCNKKKKIK